LSSVGPALATPRRQSKLAPVFIALGSIRRIGALNGAIAFFALFNRLSSLWVQLAIGLAVVALIGAAVARWWMFRFQVNGDELEVEQGVFRRDRQTLPLSRIQSVATDQKFLHRLFGLVQLRVETAGSAGAEFDIEAIDRATAASIRRLVTAERSGQSASAQSAGAGLLTADPHAISQPTSGTAEPSADLDGVPVLRRTPIDLFKVALTQNPLPGILVFGVLFGNLDTIGRYTGVSGDDIEDRLENIDMSIVPIIIGLLALLLTVMVIVGVLRTMAQYFNLTLLRTPEGLRSTAGLLNRVERGSQLSRIQMVRSRQNLRERFFGQRIVTLPTASSTIGDSHTLRLPGTTADELQELRDLFLRRGGQPSELDHGISRHAVTRWFLYCGLVPAVVVAAIAGFRFGFIGLAAFLWLIPAWFGAQVVHRKWRWGLTDEGIEVHHGVFTRHTALTAFGKTQVVQLRRSLFHRRNDLATVVIATASGRVALPHLPLATANALRDRVLYRAETDPTPWM